MRVARTFPLMAAILLVCMLPASRAVELTLSCNPIEAPHLKACVEEWARKTGHAVKVVTGPPTSSDVLPLYLRQLEAGAPDVDIYEVDVIWPGVLANHLLDLTPYAKDTGKLHLRQAIENNTVRGRLVAMPLYLDVGMMFYRKDLLEKHNLPVPATWPELSAIARKIVSIERGAGSQRLWGLVFQGRAYEGLTCCALEWIDSHGGGAILDAGGKVTVNNPRALAALKEAASWIGSVTPQITLDFAEEESRGAFQSGDAVFMRNWPYAWALLQAADSPVRGKVGIMPIPPGGAGGKPAGTLGGWGLAVSKYSKNPDVAAELALWLAGPEGQKKFCLLGAYAPSLVSLFDDPEIKAANPAAVLDIFTNAVPRPATLAGAKYSRLSAEFFNTVHAILSKRERPEAGLGTLERNLNRLAKDGWGE